MLAFWSMRSHYFYFCKHLSRSTIFFPCQFLITLSIIWDRPFLVSVKSFTLTLILFGMSNIERTLFNYSAVRPKESFQFYCYFIVCIKVYQIFQQLKPTIQKRKSHWFFLLRCSITITSIVFSSRTNVWLTLKVFLSW